MMFLSQPLAPDMRTIQVRSQIGARHVSTTSGQSCSQTCLYGTVLTR